MTGTVGLSAFDPSLVLRTAGQLVVVLLAVRLASAVARRVGQPAITAEIAVGVLLGPSVLGALWPAAGEFVAPGDPLAAAPLNVVAWLGVVLLVLLAGAEVDLGVVRGRGRAVVTVAVGAAVLPFAAGLAVGAVLPGAMRGPAGGAAGGTAVFALFIAVTVSVSALPVIARVLGELGLLRTALGSLTLAVALVVDLFGWTALGVIAAMARSGGLGAGMVLGPVVGVLVVVVAAGGLAVAVRVAVRARARRVPGPGPDDGSGASAAVVGTHGDGAGAAVTRGDGRGELVAVVVAALAMALVAQAVGSEAIVGAFLAGLVLAGVPAVRDRVVRRLEGVTLGVLAPVFFVAAGLRVDLGSLADPTVLAWGAVYLAVSVVAKLVGAGLGGLVGGLPRRSAAMLAVGLNCRGAVEVVVASTGLSLGVLSTASYTVVVLMALLTTVMAPPLLRLLSSRDTAADFVRVT